MKKIFTLCLLAFMSVQANAQKLVATIAPSEEVLVPCLGTIEPMQLPLDKWNFAVQNETVENWMNPEARKIMREKTKLKLERLGKKELC